jgi:hypothetical protein
MCQADLQMMQLSGPTYGVMQTRCLLLATLLHTERPQLAA